MLHYTTIDTKTLELLKKLQQIQEFFNPDILDPVLWAGDNIISFA